MADFLLNVWRCLSMYASDVFWHVMYRPKAFGLENIPKQGGVIIASNHTSNLEPMFLGYYAVKSFGRFSMRQVWSPAKEELFFFPLGLIIRLWRAFPVKRNSHDFKSMARIAQLAREHVVLIFPEGTRSRDGRLGPGKSGVGKIIYDSRAAVVPTVLFNTRHCLPKGARFPKFFLPLAVVFGKPIDLSRFYNLPDCKENSQAIADEVMRGIAALQKEYAHLDVTYNGGA